MLVAAVVGLKRIKAAYTHAVAAAYRLSFVFVWRRLFGAERAGETGVLAQRHLREHNARITEAGCHT